MKNKAKLLECDEFVDLILGFVLMNSDTRNVMGDDEVKKTELLLKAKGFVNEDTRWISVVSVKLSGTTNYRLYINEYSARNSYSSFEITSEFIKQRFNR